VTCPDSVVPNNLNQKASVVFVTLTGLYPRHSKVSPKALLPVPLAPTIIK